MYTTRNVMTLPILGDELFPGKISFEDFKTTLQALQTMKKKYDWLVTWENEGGTSWTTYFKDGIPLLHKYLNMYR